MYCPKCGTENLDDAQFCKKCGYEFSKKEFSFEDVKEKVIAGSEKVSNDLKPVISKIGLSTRSFYQETLIPFYQKKVKPNPKPFLVAFLILVLLGSGFGVFQKITSSKKVSGIAPLEELSLRFENWGKNFDEGMSSKLLDNWMKEGLELTTLYQKAVNSYLDLAKSLNPKHPEKFKELLEKEEILKDLANYEDFYRFLETNGIKGGKEFQKIFSESSVLLNKIKIDKSNPEVIKAKYQEKENKKIPIGYSFITMEPENGGKQDITVTVEGKNKETVSIITKEPKDGAKIIGTGSVEDIANIVSVRLGEIIKLFKNQNLTAAAILPSLDEENKEKAISWENEYKNTAFNWRRFDDYEIIQNQIIFEKTSYYGKNQTLSIKIFLPIKVKYYQNGYWGESTPKITFYYDKEKDDWVSTNETIGAIFNIINNQLIPAMVSANSFTFSKTKDCDLYNREVKIEQIGISGKNTLKGNFSGNVGSIDFLAGDYQIEPINIGSSLTPDLINKINSEKITNLIGKTFKYEYSGWGSSYKCEASPNITFSFFNE